MIENFLQNITEFKRKRKVRLYFTVGLLFSFIFFYYIFLLVNYIFIDNTVDILITKTVKPTIILLCVAGFLGFMFLFKIFPDYLKEKFYSKEVYDEIKGIILNIDNDGIQFLYKNNVKFITFENILKYIPSFNKNLIEINDILSIIYIVNNDNIKIKNIRYDSRI